jgi:hypothetical protein
MQMMYSSSTTYESSTPKQQLSYQLHAVMYNTNVMRCMTATLLQQQHSSYTLALMCAVMYSPHRVMAVGKKLR